MNLTSDDVRALAPDPKVAAAGQDLARPVHWQNVGRGADALWGECHGSALYRVQVDLSSMAFRCSCPSRRHPCKHVVGLLFLAASDTAAPQDASPPAWVEEWLSPRRARQERQEPDVDPVTASAKPKKTGGDATSKRARERLERVLQGVDALDLWMADLVRNGLAGLEAQPQSFWEQQAARLVDAQAPGLAARVRHMATVPGSSPRWPDRLLGDLGRLALLTHALRRVDELDQALQHDVRRLVGWTLNKQQVSDLGNHVTDEWIAVGRRVDDEEKIVAERTWLAGVRTGRRALVLQYAPGRSPSFPHVADIGTGQEMELVFWPGAYPQRARIETRLLRPVNLHGGLPSLQTVREFLAEVAATLSVVPWHDRFLCLLANVVPVPSGSSNWTVQDADGDALPLAEGWYWQLLALSGGHPLQLAAEWDGSALWPFGVVVDNAYRRVSR
ncbi:MAG: SWIM zinc finger family protein [Chloroflexota bacterium]